MAPPRPPRRPLAPRAPEAPRAPRPTFSMAELLPMSIFSRTRDIVAANVSDMLDRAEDPAKMVRMIIVEMEETLVEVRASSARTIAEQKELRREAARIARIRDGWDEKAELALSKGREDLARAALVQKRQAADLTESLELEAARLDAALRAAEEDVARLQAKLRDARTRQAAIRARMESADTRIRLREMHSGPRVEDAFARFDLLERRADLAEGHAEALALARPKTLEEEMAELKAAEAVDAEFEALKARLAPLD